MAGRPVPGATRPDVGRERIDVEDVAFPNGNRAVVVRARPRHAAADLVAALGLTGPRPVLVVVGGAADLDPVAGERLRTLFERGVAPVVEATGAVVVDGGTASGVMAIAGASLGAAGIPLTLVGVAPAGRVAAGGDGSSGGGSASGGAQPSGGSGGAVSPSGEPARVLLEPNHSQFVLASSDRWGGETRLLFEVAETLAGSEPVAVLVAGGGPVTGLELLEATERHWPIVVLAGTGGTADGVAVADAARREAPAATVADPGVEAIVERAELTIVAGGADPAALERHLLRRLQPDATLGMAWQTYAALSLVARQQQRSFRVLQGVMLGLGVLATTLVVIQVTLQHAGRLAAGDALASVLHYAIVIVPIVVATLIATAGRLRPGSRSVRTRGTAESIKSEIYRYRARAGRYAPARTRIASREARLAEAVGVDLRDLAGNEPGLPVIVGGDPDGDAAAAHSAPGDDGVRPLSPADYVRFRLDDQVDYYQSGVRRRERQARLLRWLVLLAGALGTFLAAVLLEPWVAVTSAFAAAIASYLEVLQLESTIVLHGRAATDLALVRAWWMALPPEAQQDPGSVDRLVDRAERIMGTEHRGWIAEMQDAIAHLRLEQADAGPGAGRGDGAATHDAGAAAGKDAAEAAGDEAARPHTPGPA